MSLNQLIEHLEELADDMTRKAASGEITVKQWRLGMKQIIRDGHNAASELGLAGEQLNIFQRAGEWLRRQHTIRQQMGYLRGFENQIRNGLLDSESLLGAVRARARMYGNAARTTFDKIRQQIAKLRGRKEKRRVLSGNAKHCNTCLEQARLGWVPIDDPRVTAVGENTECMSADRCSIDYR